MSEARGSSTTAESPSAPDRRPGLLALLALLAVGYCLSVLHSAGMFPAGFFRLVSGVSDGAFDAQLVLMVVGVMLMQVVPERFAKTVAIVEGLACLAFHGPLALVYVGGLFAWFVALEAPLPRRLRPAVAIVLLLATGLAGRRWAPNETLLFSALFHVRLLVYAWDRWQRGFPRGNLVDFAFYLLTAPLIVFPPYVVLIPFYERHAATFAPRLTMPRIRQAVGYLGAGLVSELVYQSLPLKPPPTSGWLATHALFYLLFVVGVSRVANIAFGLLLLHGHGDERPPLRAPLLASDFVEMWSRLQTHQKDLQVAFFYTPVIIRLRRANRYVATIAATAFTLFVGNFALHLLIRYIYSEQPFSTVVALYRFFFAMFVLVSATLCLQEWRRRTKRRAPTGLRGLAYTLLCWAATQLVAMLVF